MGSDGSTSRLSETADDVVNSGREASLVDELSNEKSSKGCLLRGLEDDSVTGGQ